MFLSSLDLNQAKFNLIKAVLTCLENDILHDKFKNEELHEASLLSPFKTSKFKTSENYKLYFARVYYFTK